MSKYVLGGLFFGLLALNVAGYLYFVNEIDGSTVISKKTMTQPQLPERDLPTR